MQALTELAAVGPQAEGRQGCPNTRLGERRGPESAREPWREHRPADG